MSDKKNLPEVHNRKAAQNFHIMDKYETGLMLTGTEVKSIREGKGNISEAYVEVTAQLEIYLLNSYIDEYSHGNQFNHDPRRKRKLLAHRSEILKMRKARELKGLTIVPLRMYFKGRLVKVEVAVCRGKDKGDKRQDIIAKTEKREVERAIKSSRR